MFNFLKKLFSKLGEEKIKKEEIKIEELENWFKTKSGSILKDLDIKIENIKNKIKEEITKTKDNLSILSAANLHNPKISVKETQFMEGNRNAYILGVNNFLRGIDLENKGYSSLLDFCNEFNVRLEKFGKSTFRSYHILQEFFANESRDIAINIKNLDNSTKELRETMEKANINKIDEIKSNIIELNTKIKQKNELESILKNKIEFKESLIKNKKDIEKRINELIKSNDYKKLNELNVDKEIILANVKDYNIKIIHAFSVMERPLKKLTRVIIEDSELLDKYIENPVKALVSDNELKIMALLKKLESNLNNYTLDLKDKKREKVLETIKGLTEDFFKEFVSKHNELNKRLEDLENSINENDAFKIENKLNYELDNTNNNLEEVNSEILENEEELSKIDVEGMKSNLKSKINELLKVNVVIP